MLLGWGNGALEVLTPLLPHERRGAVSNVVFPTGIDQRLDLGLPDRIDVYYGMHADTAASQRVSADGGGEVGQ